MPEVCSCCGGTGYVDEPDPVSVLRAQAIAHGHWVSPNDEVRTDGAAFLLGVQPATLRQDRCYYGRIPCRRVGGRALYALTDLAERLFPSMPD